MIWMIVSIISLPNKNILEMNFSKYMCRYNKHIFQYACYCWMLCVYKNTNDTI